MQRNRAVEIERDRLQRRMDELLALAEKAEFVDQGQSTPMWTEFLLPAMQRRVQVFHDTVLTLDPAEFEKERAVAVALTELINLVEGLSGKGAGLRAEAERILRLLERAEQAPQVGKVRARGGA